MGCGLWYWVTAPRSDVSGTVLQLLYFSGGDVAPGTGFGTLGSFVTFDTVL